jgi:hypothetical protein
MCLAQGVPEGYSTDPEVSPGNNFIKQQVFDFVRSQYMQRSWKVVMPASSHKDVKL